MAQSPTTSQVRSGDVTLAVREHSPAGPDRTSVLLVHGYPDRQDTWDTLVEHLPLDRWHVVTYDVRGAGGSGAPSERDGYRTDRLVDDLVAVLDAVTQDRTPVHLVGHDWGSVQLWDAVLAEAGDPRLTGRIASFTSVSGPSLDHAGWVLRHPQGRDRAVRRQRLRSSYIAFFSLPVVPDLVWRLAHRPLGRLMVALEGLPRGHFGPGLGRDAANGLDLYRANVGRRPRRPHTRTDVPVLVVHPRRDRFLTAVLTEDLDRECTDVRVEVVDGGHWVAVTDPQVVADLLVDHVDRHVDGH